MGLVHSGIVGQYVLPSIHAATKSLDIVSPYLSPEYAKLLSDKADQGIVVRLITSDAPDNRRHQQALRILKRQPGRFILGSRFSRYFILTILLGLLGVLLSNYYVGFTLLVFAFVVLLVGLAKNVTRKQLTSTPLFVKIIPGTQLVHVKLYIVDQLMAFVGSANLTYSGMNRNIERIEVKSTPSEVQPEMGVFASLWGPQPLPVIPSTTPSHIARPSQPGKQRISDDVMTRSEAEAFEKLYGNFPATSASGSAARSNLTFTWQDRLRSAIRKLLH